ncbi:hypothetical protein FBU30_009803 [Linnemannia zychae]|nr:hypothetical protein FBU30_009803 [Linnemannia zychae]
MTRYDPLPSYDHSIPNPSPNNTNPTNTQMISLTPNSNNRQNNPQSSVYFSTLSPSSSTPNPSSPFSPSSPRLYTTNNINPNITTTNSLFPELANSIRTRAASDTSEEAIQNRYRMAIIADPQLTDWLSYHQSGLLLAIVETYTDIYMKRSFRRLHASLRPDAVLFLGDLNDGGRITNNATFIKNTNRFIERVFATKSSGWNQDPIVTDAIKDESEFKPVINSLNSNNKVKRQALSEEEEAAYVNITGHYVQRIEAPLEANKRQQIRNTGKSLRLYVAETPTLPRILFTHVPLFRPDTTYCGKTRETKQLIINRGGEQYWNMVSSSLSQEILEGIQPDMVFSGDDHDWCEIAHPTIGGSLIPEVTLRTFSFAQGIQQPAFVMMSLFNPLHKIKNTFPLVHAETGLPVSNERLTNSIERPSGDTTFVYDECMLPNQMLIYICYGALLAISLSWILIRQYSWMSLSKKRGQFLPTFGRWRDKSNDISNNCNVHTNDTQDGSIGSSSSRADQCLYDTTFEAELREIDPYYDAPIGPISLETISNTDRERKLEKRWPLFVGLFWKRVGRDLWGIFKYALPFYVFLFICSII